MCLRSGRAHARTCVRVDWYSLCFQERSANGKTGRRCGFHARSRFHNPSAGRCLFEIGELAIADKDSGGLRVTGCRFTRTTEPFLKPILRSQSSHGIPIVRPRMSKGSLIFVGWVGRETGVYSRQVYVAHDVQGTSIMNEWGLSGPEAVLAQISQGNYSDCTHRGPTYGF